MRRTELYEIMITNEELKELLENFTVDEHSLLLEKLEMDIEKIDFILRRQTKEEQLEMYKFFLYKYVIIKLHQGSF